MGDSKWLLTLGDWYSSVYACVFKTLVSFDRNHPAHSTMLAEGGKFKIKYTVLKTSSGLCMSKHPSYAGREMQCEEEFRVTLRRREGEGGCTQTGLQHLAKFAKNIPPI